MTNEEATITEETPARRVTKAPKIARDVAEQEFYKFADAMYLDVDPVGMNDEDKKHLELGKRAFLRAVMDGYLIVNSKGEPVLTPQNGGNPITFREPVGEALMARDQKRPGHEQAKLVVTMSQITGEDESRFKFMLGRDLKVCEAITLLLLA